MITNYLDLYGFQYNTYPKIFWGQNTYTRVLGREYPDEETSLTTSSSCDTLIELIFTENIKNTYYIDGTVMGNIKVVNSHSSTTYPLKSYGIYIKKIDRTGSETKFEGFKREFIYNLEPAYGTYVSLPFFFDVREAEIKPNEKLIVCVDVRVMTGTRISDIKLLHSNFTQYGYDFHIKLPITVNI